LLIIRLTLVEVRPSAREAHRPAQNSSSQELSIFTILAAVVCPMACRRQTILGWPDYFHCWVVAFAQDAVPTSHGPARKHSLINPGIPGEGRYVREIGQDLYAWQLHHTAAEPSSLWRGFISWTSTSYRSRAGSGRARASVSRSSSSDGFTRWRVRKRGDLLGSTPDICRKCYAHPCITELYLAGELLPRLKRKCRKIAGLSAQECMALSLIRDHRDFPA
jgi:hypothetical protein